MFYVTPTRSALNLFTMAFDTNQGLVVVAKRAYTFDEYIAGQAAGTLKPVCTKAGAAFSDWLADNLPSLTQVPATRTYRVCVACACITSTHSRRAVSADDHRCSARVPDY
jgi:hypothetical protein